MTPEINPADAPIGVAVLLHPHPDYGGNRHHPFVDGLYRRLPEGSVSALRFDFSTGDMESARGETRQAVAAAKERGPDMPVVLVGYSFGAAAAAGVAGEPIVAWFLLAPPAVLLGDATIGDQPGPKAIHVPERDQYSAPSVTSAAVADWVNTTVSVVPGADHFLGVVGPIVDSAFDWVVEVLRNQRVGLDPR
jgi:alpha/beta superfamily hydrolase